MSKNQEELTSIIKFDENTAKARREALEKMDNVMPSPVEAQVAFIKELIKNPGEAKKFFAAPKEYAVEHAILIDPMIVKKVVDQAMFDIALDEDFCGTVGPHVTKDLVDIRNKLKPGTIPQVGPNGEPINPVANAAAVAAGAAVVMAVVMVVTMVVTLIRTKRPADLVSLQGLGKTGTLLPGGIRFTDRTGIRIAGLRSGLTGLRG